MARQQRTINRKEQMEYSTPQAKAVARGSNPSTAIKNNREMLGAITNPEELKQKALEIVGQYLGQGFSEQNWVKFQRDLEGAAEQGLTGLRRYLTNYAMSGHGMSVLQLRREGQEAIAEIILESIEEILPLTPEKAELKIWHLLNQHVGKTIHESAFEAYREAMPDDPTEFKAYLAEMVLSQHGMQLVESSQDAIACMLTESELAPLEMSADQKKIAAIFKDYGFNVTIAS